jgi:endonuclease YncB( thermonuclease family)
VLLLFREGKIVYHKKTKMKKTKPTELSKGMLTLTGTIDLTQFWPENVKSGNTADSDADTVKVKINPKSVQFKSPAGKTSETDFISKSGFFHNVKGAGGKTSLKFKPVIDSKGNIDMRLQGIDAPELHYMTQIHGNPLYRQPMGETSTVQLFKFLQSHTPNDTIDCEVFTQVNMPNDVFDKFGRCVGDIVIKDKNGKMVNVNQWLVENGWAFPAYYNSMTPDEIKVMDTLANKAMADKLNIWKFFSQQMGPLDKKLTHSKKDGTYSAAKDEQPPVIFPKLFRRLWTFEIQDQNAFSDSGYQKFMATQKSDVVCNKTDFIKSGFPKKPPLLASFIGSNGSIKFKPADVIFKEGGTTLKDSKGNKITSF